MIHPKDYFDLSDEIVAALFAECTYVWQAVAKIAHHVQRLVGQERTILGDVLPGAFVGEQPVYIGEGARIEPGAYVHGPAFIASGAVVRHGAFVRENVILMSGAVLGHASEAKNALFLPNAHAPHFNYVGDSILGHRVNLGAGTKLSNLGIMSEKDDTGKRPSTKLVADGKTYDTGLAKLGAIIGDDTQTGCNSVLNPGCLIGPNSLVYANLSLRKGIHPPNSIHKLRQTVRRMEKKNANG